MAPPPQNVGHYPLTDLPDGGVQGAGASEIIMQKRMAKWVSNKAKQTHVQTEAIMYSMRAPSGWGHEAGGMRQVA